MTSATVAIADRFRLAGRTYNVIDPTELSLSMLIQLEIETERMGRRMSLADFEQLNAEWEAHKQQGGKIPPGFLWLLGCTVWSARRMAGEDVSFADAVDFHISDLVWLPAPEDHKPAKKAGGKATPRKARPAKKAASGRAGARQAAEQASPSEQPPTSAPES